LAQVEPPAARVRLIRAVNLLATSPDSLQERVSMAWLELMPLRQDDFPDVLHDAFGVIEAEMLAAPDDPSVMSDEVATRAAERIVLLALEMWGR
jgi:hypothetical protein